MNVRELARLQQPRPLGVKHDNGQISLLAPDGAVGFFPSNDLATEEVGTGMPISPEYLPSELHYIIPLAERHGSEARVAKFDRRLGRHVQYAETLSEDDIELLRQLYTEISNKGHSLLINSWHEGHDLKGTCPPETTWPIFGLLCLFAQLGKLDIAPFNDGAVCPQKVKREALDWSKLPPPLRYLAGPAEKYGRLQFDDPIYEFLQERMTADERAELQALSRRFGQDGEAIDRWLDEFRITEHPEAGLVYFTGLCSVSVPISVCCRGRAGMFSSLFLRRDCRASAGVR